jgi:ubiquinone biosynthesis protein
VVRAGPTDSQISPESMKRPPVSVVRHLVVPGPSAIELWLRIGRVSAVFTARFLRIGPAILVAILKNRRDEAYYNSGLAFASAAEQLGPVFIKLAQMVSYRTDVLPAPFLAPLARLQDQVNRACEYDVREQLGSLGVPVNEIFKTLDRERVGSGSVASVYKATTVSNATVAIKIVDSRAQKLIDRDLKWVRHVAVWLSCRRFDRYVPIVEIFDRLEAIIRRQVDMRSEADNLNAVRQSISRFRGILIPAPRMDIALDTRVLVMEYIECFSYLGSDEISAEAFQKGMRNLLRALYKMMFVDGIVHCDLHPGNVRVDQEGNVYLLDVGLIDYMSATDRSCFRDFFISFVMKSAKSATEALLRCAVAVPDGLNYDGLVLDIRKLIGEYSGRRAGTFLVTQFVSDLFDVHKRHQIVAGHGFVAAIWSLMMFEGLVRDRFPELDFQAEAKPFAIAALSSYL